MKNSFLVEEYPGYIVFRVSGQDSLQFSMDYWQKVGQVCNEKKVYKALIVEDLQGQISMSEMYELCEALPHFVLGLDIAFIDNDPEHSYDNLFGETVARNRGVNINDFSNEKDAIAWLLETD